MKTLYVTCSVIAIHLLNQNIKVQYTCMLKITGDKGNWLIRRKKIGHYVLDSSEHRISHIFQQLLKNSREYSLFWLYICYIFRNVCVCVCAYMRRCACARMSVRVRDSCLCVHVLFSVRIDIFFFGLETNNYV